MMTRTDAIDQLVALDVNRWGEAERDASYRMNSRLSHGLALNKLAHHDIDKIDEQMALDAMAVMTLEDHRQLRAGG